MDTPPLNDAERLALETEWLQRLARRLVGDAHAAEDVVQDTLVAALDRPAWAREGDGALRRWLGGTVRNLARLGRRSASRRADRERIYSEGKPASEQSPDEIVERARGARQLMDAVLELDEPYRTAVLLSYGEGLDAPTIAAREGVNPAAIRKRISRGIARLRGTLADGDDGPPEWLLGVAGLAAPTLHPAAAATAAGGLTSLTSLALTMKSLPVVAAAAVLASVGLWNLLGQAAPAPPDQATRQTGSAPSTSPDTPLDPLVAQGATAGARTRGSERGPAADASPANTSSIVPPLRGRVVLAHDGSGLAGATLHAADAASGPRPGAPYEDALFTTGRDGTFEIAFDAEIYAALANRGLWVRHDHAQDIHVSAGRVATLAGADLVVETVPLGRLDVLVLDGTGSPAPGESITYSMKPTHGSDAQMWSYQGPRAGGTSNSFGRVVLEDLPTSTEIRIGFRGEATYPARAVIDPVTLLAEATLRPSAWGEVTAMLRWPDGSPAVDVPVTWHGASHKGGSLRGVERRSDAEGRLTVNGLNSGAGQLVFTAGAFHPPVHARSERGSITDAGELTVSRPVTLSGKVELGSLSSAREGLRVVAFSGGVPVAEHELGPGLDFSLDVPIGPTLVAVTRDLSWNPILPFRGSFLGQTEASAPAENVTLHCAALGGQITGEVATGESSVKISFFDEDGLDPFGHPVPIGGADGVEVQLDGSGRFHLPMEPGRRTWCLIEGDEGRASYTRLAPIDAEEVKDLGAIQWTRTRLEVLVVDGKAAPVAGAKVQARSANGALLEAMTLAGGTATFDVAAGPFGLQTDAGAAGSSPWSLVHAAGPVTRATLALAGRSTLTGTVRTAMSPAANITVRAQCVEPISNLLLSATSDASGTFTFKPLSPGLYRYTIRGELAGVARLEDASTTSLDLLIGGAATRVEVRSAGALLRTVERLDVRDADDPGAPWRSGERLGVATFEAPLPGGDLLFTLDLAGLGNNQLVVARSGRATGPRHVLELPETSLELRLTGALAQAPPPSVYLTALDGRPASTKWGGQQELYAEDQGIGSDGVRTVRVPYLDPGATLLLRGVDGEGRRKEERLELRSGGTTVLDWR